MRIWTILSFIGILYMFMYIKLIPCLKGSRDIKRPITILWIGNIRSGASIFLYCCILNNSTISREYLHLSWHRTSRIFIREKSKQMRCESPYIASDVKIDSKLVPCFDENSEDNLENFFVWFWRLRHRWSF